LETETSNMGFFDGLKEHTNDIVMLGTLLCSVMWLMAAKQLFSPEVADSVGIIGYLFILFIGIFGSTVVIREITNSYPNIHMTNRTDGYDYSLYIRQSEEATEQQVGPNQYATTLPLRFKTYFPDYGKVDKVILHHVGHWGDVMLFKPGKANWNNVVVDHPQTTKIVVSQTPGATVAVDYGESIPVFYLRDSPKFYTKFSACVNYGKKELEPEALKELDNSELANALTDLSVRYNQLVEVYNETNRSQLKWHRERINLAETNAHQRVELQAEQESQLNFTDSVNSRLLTLVQVHGGIKNAFKSANRGKTNLGFLTNKWFILLVVAALAFAFVNFNPSVSEGIQYWFSNPVNQIFVLALIGLIVAGVYFVMRHKKSRK
jgi:hypothetical protein